MEDNSGVVGAVERPFNSGGSYYTAGRMDKADIVIPTTLVAYEKYLFCLYDFDAS